MIHNPDHPAGGAGAVKVPDGWALVPLEPTVEMRAAGRDMLRDLSVEQLCTSDAADTYRAMLALSPAPPACETCSGHGLIGGFRAGDGYDAEPCPDCSPPVPEPEAEGEAVAPVMWQWRSRLKGGTWDAWERGRFNQEVPPFAEVEERALYTHPPASEIAGLRAEIERHARDYSDLRQTYDTVAAERDRLRWALAALVLNIDAGGTTLSAMSDARQALAGEEQEKA